MNNYDLMWGHKSSSVELFFNLSLWLRFKSFECYNKNMFHQSFIGGLLSPQAQTALRPFILFQRFKIIILLMLCRCLDMMRKRLRREIGNLVQSTIYHIGECSLIDLWISNVLKNHKAIHNWVDVKISLHLSLHLITG